MKNIIILGAGYAGMMAALRLSHTSRKRKDVKVTLINAGDYFMERIRFHEVAAGHPPKRHAIVDLLRGSGIEFVQAQVLEVHPNTNTVVIQTKDGKVENHYDKLVYALGSMVAKDMIPGVVEHAYTLNAESAQKLQSKLKNLDNGKRVVIVGGGFTGIETATEIAESYPNLQVSLLTNGKLGQELSRKGQNYVQTTFDKMNIEVLEDRPAGAIEANRLVMQDGSYEATDIVVWTAGFVVPELARESGFAVDKSGRIIVDAYLRSVSHPDVFVAGDAMNFENRSRLNNRMSCQSAMPLGAHTGDNLANWISGETLAPFAFAYQFHCISLGQKRGLAQVVNPDDSMKEQVFTGRIGALIKRIILNYTLWSIQLERRFPAYIWLKSIQLVEHASSRTVAEH